MCYTFSMVLMKELNKICSERKVAKDFPSQIICRLLGSKNSPCQLNKLCEQAEIKGIWYFYTAVLLFVLLVYLVLFWLLRLTKLSKLCYPLAMILIIPLEWLATCFAATIQFLRKLPF